jgi:hypothetical protein
VILLGVKNAIRRSIEHMPPRSKGVANLLVHAASGAFGPSPELFLARGRPGIQMPAIQFAHFGESHTFAHWRARVFDEPPSVESLAPRSLREVALRSGVLSDCDVVLYPVNAATARILQAVGWFIVPKYVKCYVDLGRPLGEILRSRDVKNELRLLRKLDYRFEVLREESAFDEWYEQMLLPTQRERHAELAVDDDHDFLLSRFRRGYLLAAYLDSEWVGANLLVPEGGGVLRSANVGWRGGSRALMKQRIVSALLHEVIRHAQCEDYETLDLGGSKAFADDGPLLYKLKWGARMDLPRLVDEAGEPDNLDAMLAMHVNLKSPSAHSILDRMPPIVNLGGRLGVLTWSASPRPELKRQIERGMIWKTLGAN